MHLHILCLIFSFVHVQLRVEQLEEENALQELSVESQARIEHVEREVWQLMSLLEEQNSWIHKQIELCKGETDTLQAEVRELEEGTRLTEAVNSATQLQLQVQEGTSLSPLKFIIFIALFPCRRVNPVCVS